MVTASTKKLRDWIAIAFLAWVGLRLLLAFIALLTADTGFGVGFAEKSYVIAGTFAAIVPILLVTAAVVLVTHLGEPTRLGRVLTIVAMGELGVMLLLGLLTWIAGLTTDSADALGLFGSLPLAGKAVGGIDVFLGLVLIGLALYFCLVTFNALPKPVRQAPAWGGGQPGWGPPPGQGGQQGGQQGWGPPQLQQPQPSQQGWGQPDHGQGDRSQPVAPGQGWGSSPDPWGQSQGQQTQGQQTQGQQAQGQPYGQPQGQSTSPWESERRPEPASYEPQSGSYEPQSGSYGQAPADPQPEPYSAGSSPAAWGRAEDTGRDQGQDTGPSWSEPQGEGSADSSASSWGQPSWGEPVQSQEYGTPRPVDPEPQPEREPEREPEAQTSWQPDAQPEPESQTSWQPDAQPEPESRPEPEPAAQPEVQPEPTPEPDRFAEPEPADRTAQFEAVPADEPERTDPSSDPYASDDTRTEESDREDGGSSGWWNPGQR